ncbi:MAG: NAD(P)-dependent glycerol-3-phosphate dehydrogenase [Ruminococcus flavefaciens]|nr:NAD(P)-dependent glycerol-3-phosphate dehydrogenase [Ruminococcus flavefaciens]MCM1229684.1 NAD(P)-dependent glycerol-3-phosphate dehydrogenase [Ruminococcus flavefaciens]
MADIVILGSGGFGLSLAVSAIRKGRHKVTVWSKFQQEIDEIRANGEHIQKLPGVKIPEEITLTSDISCIKGCDILIFGIPSSFVRDIAQLAKPYVDSDMVVVNTGKGIEEGSLKLLSDVISEELDTQKLVVLSGPSHAEEVARAIPTTMVAASSNKESAKYIQEQLGSSTLRIYLNDDVKGCELGGALKNIIALCCGICDGMGYGDNTKAALMTRGIHEITRLGTSAGANPITFTGLTGIGDLIVTCTSVHSRNARAGKLIGQGLTPEEAVKQVGTVEGYFCCHTAYALAQKLGVEMPITEQLNNVLFHGSAPESAITALMSRPMIYEHEELQL